MESVYDDDDGGKTNVNIVRGQNSVYILFDGIILLLMLLSFAHSHAPSLI
ncbi:MAG: hypothetical protein ACI8RD_007240 [Bacillariaceae sp.]|jgi:hypothetical protein